MYEYKTKSQQPMGLVLNPQMWSQGLGVIQPSGAEVFRGGTGFTAMTTPGMGVIQPSEAQVFDSGVAIDECANGGCQNGYLGNVSPNGGSSKPWWFWLAAGAGIGGALYLVSKSNVMRGNPEDADITDSDAAQQAAAIAVQANVPIILWGAPGIGKTSWLEALGKAMGAKVFTVIGSTKDPADIGGIMNIDGTLIPPLWAKEIEQRSLKGQRSILFLDEFSSMSPLVHAALLRVVRDKIAGDLDFDPKFAPLQGDAVHVVTAANPPDMGAGSVDLPPPAANRLIHIDWPTPTALEWGLGLLTGWKSPKLAVLPKDWHRSLAMRSAREDVGAFLSWKQEHVLTVPPDVSDAGKEWPSPRSWEMATEALGAARAVGAPKLVQFKLIVGSIGAVAGGEFFEWLDARKMPDAEQLLREPNTYDIPDDRPDQLFAAARSVIDAVKTKPTVEKWETAWDFLENVADRAEMASPPIDIRPFAVLADALMKMKAREPKLKKAPMPDEALINRFRVTGINVYG